MKIEGIKYSAAVCCVTLGQLIFPGCTQKKPNIIFILADDLGYHQVGAFGGGSFYETPNINSLAKEGIRFTNAYAAAPVSSPTRGSIMTGKYPARTNLTVNLPAKYDSKKLNTAPFSNMLSESEVTIAEILKENGYKTGHFGKWHLNVDKDYQPDRPGDPESQGFDEVLHTEKPSGYAVNTKGSDWHNTDKITQRSISFIERNRDKPFFCYVSYNAIHRPELERDEMVVKYRGKEDADNDDEYGFNNPVQAAMLETMDKGIGTIIQKVADLGISDNTVIVFFSDNGQLRNRKDAIYFRGSKADLYEGGIRMPLVIKWSKIIEPGTTSNEMVISTDFFPTLCELAGIDKLPKDIDGISLVPVLKDADAKLDRDAIYWHFPHYHGLGIEPQGAIRMGKYKLVENFNKSLFNEPGGWELFDLESDPKESINIVDKLPDITNKLKNELQIWRQSVAAQMMTINPDYENTTK